MMNKKFGILATVLACLILCMSLLTGCNSGTGNGKTTEPADSQDSSGGDEMFDKNGYLKDSLPSSLNYNSDPQVKILYWSDVEMPEFTVDSMSGDRVSNAIYTRNLTVATRLNVDLTWIPQPGRNTSLQEYAAKVNASVMNNLREYDILAGYSQTIASVTYAGNTMNLMNNRYLDLEKPWWPYSLTDEATIGNKLYFISGDISTNALYFMYATFFNKTLLKSYSLDNPYDLVNSNEWTLETMLSMAKDVYVDRGTIGEKDYGDTFGIIVPWLSIDAYFYSSGFRTVDKDSDGALTVAPSYVGQDAERLAELLNLALFTRNSGLWIKEDTGKVNDQFGEGLVLFFTQRTKDAIQHFANNQVLDYGVVPTPKWNSSQEQYLTCIGNPFTLYSIAGDCINPDKMGAVLECLASEAYRTTTPALYEITLKTRYAKDDVTAAMYDIIRENIVFDVGRIFGMSLDNLTQTQFRNMVGKGETNWMVTTQNFKTALQIYLDTLQDELG